MPTLMDDILATPTLRHIRRNHALEHATIQVLTQRYPRALFIGRSDTRGFYLYGEIPSEVFAQVLEEALARLRQGEWHLALHPNCGTNYLAAGVLAGGAAFLTMQGGRNERWPGRLARLPVVMLAATLAVVLSQPIGLALQQRVTTEADLGTLEVLSIRRLAIGRATVHRVITSG